MPRRCAPAPVGGDDISKYEPQLSPRDLGNGREKPRRRETARHTLYLLHALSRAAATVPGRRGTRSSPRPNDMASSLPVGAPNPPPRQPAASFVKRGDSAPGLSDLARGIPKASAQSTVLWSIGDLACQKLEKRTSIDTRRLASNAAYGALVLGPVGHLWYEGALVVFCERFIPGGGAATVAAKLAFDLCVFGPAHLACFLGWSGFWSFPPAYPDDAARGGGGRKPAPSKGGAGRGEDEKKGNAADAKGPADRGRRVRRPYAPPSTAPEPPSERIFSPGSSSTPRSGHPRRRRISRWCPCVGSCSSSTSRARWTRRYCRGSRRTPGRSRGCGRRGWVVGRAGAGGDGTGRRGGRERDASHYSRRAHVVIKVRPWK